MPAPAAETPWSADPPRASADLWPSHDRSSDPWTSPAADDSARAGGEPSREGYAAWDAAPSSWIGWNTPSRDDVDETIELETPSDPAGGADPRDDQDETAPFAWPGEAGSDAEESTPPAPTDAGAAPAPGLDPEVGPAPVPGSDEEQHFADNEETDGDVPPVQRTAGQDHSDDAARDGWDAFIASRESARAKAAEGDVVARGMDLVEQLRDLLPAIVSSDPATMRRVANELRHARAEARVVPAEDLAELREVIEASRDNPRDIDALMHLGKRASDLIELMDAFERYTGAINRAASELAGGADRGAIAAGAPDDELPARSTGGA